MREWITLDGRRIPINRLSAEHLQNCIALCRRNADRYPLKDLEAELARRKKVWQQIKKGLRTEAEPITTKEFTYPGEEV